jgi:hypothetical protein
LWVFMGLRLFGETGFGICGTAFELGGLIVAFYWGVVMQQ